MTGRRVLHTATVNGLRLYQREGSTTLRTDGRISPYRGAGIADKTRVPEEPTKLVGNSVGKLKLGGD